MSAFLSADAIVGAVDPCDGGSETGKRENGWFYESTENGVPLP